MRRVVATTWDWRGTTASGKESRRNRHALRREAVVQATVMAGVGAALFFLADRSRLALLLWGLSTVLLVLGLAIPAWYRPVHHLNRALGRWTGRLLLLLLLVPFFYLFFAPVGVVLRLRNKDPLRRNRKQPGLTLWIYRAAKRRRENIADQFLREDHPAWGREQPVGAVRSEWREPSP
jgi:hypothetical protein